MVAECGMAQWAVSRVLRWSGCVEVWRAGWTAAALSLSDGCKGWMSVINSGWEGIAARPKKVARSSCAAIQLSDGLVHRYEQ